MKYFLPHEFKMGDEIVFDKMDSGLLDMLEDARESAGIPFQITSSYRNAEYNSKIGGSHNSAHLRGKAVDISCVNSSARGKILNALFKVGFRRIGIARNFIHVDNDDSLPQNVCWLY